MKTAAGDIDDQDSDYTTEEQGWDTEICMDKMADKASPKINLILMIVVSEQ